jgi:diguanylate cyclase (GGDEF)-like protein
MKTPEIPANEKERQSSLDQMDLVSTGREGDLDRITRMAQKHFNSDIALVSIIDEERQWFKSRVGLDAMETGRDISFCGHAIYEDQMLVVKNALEDERFADNPLVTGDPNIRFYAGQPLKNAQGFNIGTLCVIADETRDFDDDDQQSLRDLARMVEVVLENRELSKAQLKILRKMDKLQRGSLVDGQTGLWNRNGFDKFYEAELMQAVREKQCFAISLISADMGELPIECRDELLSSGIKALADIMMERSSKSDVIARFDEEHLVILSPDEEEEKLAGKAEKISRALQRNQTVVLKDQTYPFCIHMGTVFVNPLIDVGDLSEIVLKQAKRAIAEAKKAGPCQIVIKNFHDEVINDLTL